VAVTDGALLPIDGDNEIRVESGSVRSQLIGDYEILFEDIGDREIVVGGQVPHERLLAVLSAVRVVDGVEPWTLQLDRLPAGYSAVVAPRSTGQTAATGRGLAASDGQSALSVTSGWGDPQLAAAATGVAYQRVDVCGTAGWTGRTDSAEWPVTFLVWSPRPGLVAELDVSDAELTSDDLVALAEGMSLLPVAEWDALLEFEPSGQD
jgi:hypothetical protein